MHLLMWNTKQTSELFLILNSGITSHICNRRDAFADYAPLANSTVQALGSKHVIATGRGTVYQFDVNGDAKQHRLKDMLHVPEVANSLQPVN
jgi:hypothetical protein